MCPTKRINEYTVYLYIILFISLIYTVFYWRLIVNIHEFLQLPNYTQYLNYGEISQLPIFYNQFSNFGSINSFPLGTLEYYVIDMIFLILPAHFVGLYGATKIFIIVSSIIFGISFFHFTRIFTHNNFSRAIGTIFFILNPFMIQIYTNGDFYPIIFQSCVFIGAAFLDSALSSRNHFHPYYLLSAFLLILSYDFLDLFVVGTILYLIVIIYNVIFKNEGTNRRSKLASATGSFVTFSCSLIAIAMLYLFPILFGQSSYLPGSLSSLPLATFLEGSLNIFNVLTMKAYPPFIGWTNVYSAFGPTIYDVWSILEILLIFFLLSGYIFFKDRRLLFLSAIVWPVIFIAAGNDGPFADLAIFLYEYFPGYQAINYPYLWVWLLVAPLYSILLTIVIEDVDKDRDSNTVRPWVKHLGDTIRLFLAKRVRRTTKRRPLRIYAKYGIFLFVVIVLIVPTSTQGYYGTDGIKGSHMPDWFNTLDKTLINLTINNDSGVIFNTISDYFNFNNSTSNGLGNLLQYYPQFRTVSLSSYIPNYNAVTNFYYWFYNLLYTNRTKYSAQLLSTLGVQYFVDIYNANSEGYPFFVPWSYNVNASDIMHNQNGWSLTESTAYYSIFKNNMYNGNDYYANNISLILGDYNTLNYLAYLGGNISNLTPIFPSDLSTFNFSFLLQHTNLVVLNGNNSLYDLYLGLFNGTHLYPTSYVNGALSDGTTAWINSERSNNWPDYSSVTPFAETSGANSMTIPITVKQSGDYNVFLKVLFTNESSQGVTGGKMRILLNNGALTTLDTNLPYNGQINGFMWVKATGQFYAGKNTISLQSESGMNAVSEVCILNNSALEEATNEANLLLQKNIENTVEIFPGSQIVPFKHSIYEYGNQNTASFPGGAYVDLSSNGNKNGFSIESPVRFTGELLVSVLANKYMSLNLSYNNRYVNTTISPDIFSSIAQAPAGFLSYTVSNLTQASIKVTNSNVCFGFIALISSNYISSTTKIINSSLGNLSKEYVSPNVKNFNVVIERNSGYTFISGNFTYSNVSEHLPIILSFTNKFQYNLSPFFTSNLVGPATIEINKVSMQSQGNMTGIISPNLNDQFLGKPHNVTIEFVPWYFNNSIPSFVEFNFTFFGFLKLPDFPLFYATHNLEGPIINYSISNVNFHYVADSFLVIRSPFISVYTKLRVYTVTGGLNYAVFTNSHVVSAQLVYSSYELFTIGLEIGVCYIAGFLFISFSLWSRRKRKTKNG